MTGSEPVILASVISTLGFLASQVIQRMRCVCKPSPDSGRFGCFSGGISPDAKLEHEDHSLDIREYTIAGKDVLLLSGKDA